MNVDKIKKHYQDNMRPEPFRQLVIEEFQRKRTECVATLQVINDAVKSGKYKGNRLLEIGSAATVNGIASASAYFTEILQSDFVDANCEEQKKWLKGESYLDWSEVLKAVAEIEGYSDLEEGAQEISSRVRNCVKNVVHCDVLSDQVIPLEAGKDFDLIITCRTLESATPDFESFVDVLRRLHDLLRPGGGLFLLGYLHSEMWQVQEHTFHHLKVSKQDIDTALDLAKFGEKHWVLIPKECNVIDNYYDQMYFVSAIAL